MPPVLVNKGEVRFGATNSAKWRKAKADLLKGRNGYVDEYDCCQGHRYDI